MVGDPNNPSGKRPTQGRARRVTAAFAPGGWGRRLLKLWGFLGFCILVALLARHVLLRFVLALLLAYILGPIVGRMSKRKDGSKRMPRGLSIVICYLALLAVIGLFLVALLPRLYKDVERISREAPSLVKNLNDEYAPNIAWWLESRGFGPSQNDTDAVDPSDPLSAIDKTLPANTQMVVTPLSDGRFAVQLEPTAIEIAKSQKGGYVFAPAGETLPTLPLEAQIRSWAKNGLRGLQGHFGNIFRVGQKVVKGVIGGVFSFFLVLMIAAFILLDIEKIHGFARGLVPEGYRDDYDVIAKGVDRGLSGVIRGQLTICLVNALLTYLGLLIFKVNYSLVLAVVAGLLSLIPIFGSIISTVPIVLAALVSGSEGIDISKGVFILLWVVGIHFLEANLLNPKILGDSAKMHPVLVIFALVVGEHFYGLTGALLAVPVASIIQVLFLFFKRKAWIAEQPGEKVTT